MDPKKKVIVIAIVIVSVITLLFTGLVYQMFPYPQATEYRYSYSIRISNVEGPIELIIPLAIWNGGEVLPHLNYEKEGLDLNYIMETENGTGLYLEISSNVSYYLKGSYDAKEDLRGEEEKWLPILSMSNLDIPHWKMEDEEYLVSFKSSAGNVSIVLDLEGLYSNYKSGTILPYHIRGGGGTGYRVETETIEGWGSYPIDIGYIEVD